MFLLLERLYKIGCVVRVFNDLFVKRAFGQKEKMDERLFRSQKRGGCRGFTLSG